MKVIRWLLVLPIMWLCGYGINASGLDSDLSWTVLLDRQKGRIAESLLGKPRILLVGGSHTHYSVSAALIEQELHRGTVNLGLHAGIGLNAILARSLDRVAPGDIVVLFPEYGVLAGDGTLWLTAAFGAAIGKPTVGGVGFEQKSRMLFKSGVTSLTSLGKSAWVALGGKTGRSDKLKRIGERGDDQRPGDWVVEGAVSEHAAARLRLYRQQLEEKGAKLVIALPWIYVPANARQKSRTGAANVVAKLRDLAPIITHGANYNVRGDISLFSDSNYHANEEGRRIHTLELVSELKQVLKL
jgi:hypothetical protein